VAALQILANGKMARQARMKATREIKQEGEAEKKADKKRKWAQKLAAQKAKVRQAHVALQMHVALYKLANYVMIFGSHPHRP
jgi:hypothetical protein